MTALKEDGMAHSKESLFSLELVVEKLYIPYVTCRFPAVAFRLLDFPTILISHVEPELGDKIRKTVKNDPYFQVPNQFTELQDKHGNFMMKKGKSCLFKLSPDTLAAHLANTPLYIMVIDEYPEVPKLLGNSSLALNETMAAIKEDIMKNGHTVPSVHGDKGLFKIYSLMGKEIGYIILGFRLLSLGPGLIAHLPHSALAKRASEKIVPENKIEEEIIQVKQAATHSHIAPKLIKQTYLPKKTHEMGSMTVVDKQDALMQTVDFEDEKYHIAISDKENVPEKQFKHMYTQVNGKVPFISEVKHQNLMKFNSEEDSDNDELLLNPQFFCPPPLFYNSKAKPRVEIPRDALAAIDQYENSSLDDMTIEDLSGDEQYEKEKLRQEEIESRVPASKVHQTVAIQDARTVMISNSKREEQNNNIQSQIQNPSEAAFPLLTALLTELSKIQNPQLVNQAMQNVQAASNATKQQGEPVVKEQKANLKSEIQSNKESFTKEEPHKDLNLSLKKKGRKSHKACAQGDEGVPKQKGWIRKQPEVAVKKTKLVFGLTNTQRLRLAKGNPTWLKSAEEVEKVAKAQKQKQKILKGKEQDQDLEPGNLSDTYTEVRRLAAAELEKSTIMPTRFIEDSNAGKKVRKKSKSRDNSPAKAKQRMRSRSPKSKKGLKEKKKVSATASGEESDDEQEPVDLEPYTQNITSPDLPKGADKIDSESVPSSRIEVHIPSARAYDSDSDATLSDDFDKEYNNESERKDTKSKFPGFNIPDEPLPASIDGDAHKSINITVDEDSPLESTRMSKQFQPGAVAAESELFKSTEDYDTKQFHSTDEPELQKLISEDEKSERSESKSISVNVTPKSNRSLSPASAKGTSNKARISMNFEIINPTASQQSPLPAIRRSTMKLDSLNARPSPTNTPRSARDTPRSRSSQEKSRSSMGSPGAPPSPRPRKPIRDRRLEFKKESIHTESVSSYMPSESENILSLISDGSYSDDFHTTSEKEEKSSRLSTPELPRLIPSTKLGFTIH